MSGRRGVGVIVVPSLFVLLLALAAAPPAAAKPPVAQQTVAVRLIQLDWLGPDGQVLVECSRVAAAQFLLRGSDRQFLEANGGGWVNVVLDLIDPETAKPFWAVQNLYLVYPDHHHMIRSRPTASFGLPLPAPGGTCLASVGAWVAVTSEPWVELELPNSFAPTLVETEPYLVGGRISPDGAVSGGSGHATTPWTLGPWLGPDVYWPLPPARNWPPSPGWATRPWRDIEGVAEYIDGCAPAAATRSIKAVMGAAGIKTERASSMYSDLIDTMETGIAMGGTEDADMLTGKDEYCDGHGLPIDSGLHYGPPSLQAAQDALIAGGDVEILIAWNPNGGHAAMVTGMTQWPDGSWTITYVDDPDQSDGRAENEEHVIRVDPGGGFDGGHVDGFMLETVVP